jgi:predicted DNA-binding transcriptional regulator YafY
MPKNQDALFRQWHMLRLVPRYPQKATVQTIRNSLAAEGFEITERSIQRDLQELSVLFPLCCDNREKPYGWSWSKDAPSFDLPGLTVAEALTLTMVEQHLRDLLPTAMLDQMQTYFKVARQRLDAEPKPHRGRAWLEKVRAAPPTQPLLPAKIDHEVHKAISEALLHERQAKILYRRRGDKKSVEYRIHPLGLIQRGPMLYLTCRFSDYEDVRTLALNRIMSAECLDERAEYPADFSLDKQIASGTWGFGSGKKIALELVFQAGYGSHLHETPLGKDQVIEELTEGRLRVTATVADTPQLQWWLLGFGEGVEVISPSELRQTLAATVLAMASVYKPTLTAKESFSRGKLEAKE